MVTKVVNMHKDRHFDIDITRNGMYGNPFILGKDGDRVNVINKFRDWIKGISCQEVEPIRRRSIVESLPSMKDKVLGCVCAPNPCHGDVYVDFIEGVEEIIC
ncbi:hypothetical protein EVB32_298 [Rhizobium phage RHph_TM39]|uniref:DUF4326 domain-containing protein n=1 Tax=Rhizobium phage RHph_Y65 TaxID=2509785 RepID=A0A7S5RIH1_9CAUD|nr:unknown function [Rhizobium phage RHph_Y65]QIG71768.1 hypothetical protein EVB94_317 [Rhizobium phage RHph_TM40]QIG72129.1 hypothetical protein EVB95_315 [Rhizobium phage RHph_TM2_3B]QIG72491.1 hypothetical protein EVB96_315 [Rhizobium phage RHph_TM3_3_6]QIG77266.1 hypothetical protein EVB32_298 [Rhizobium phage RHph_TM39]QIG77881.1 hypothetical protein EVB64_315 [Rhizobium phage RHph_TM61]